MKLALGSTALRRLAVLVAAAPALATLDACAREPAGDEVQRQAGIETVTYTVRGVVAQLPDPEQPGTEFKVRHENMPHFRRPDGSLGMAAMTMPFPPAPGIRLGQLAIGQKIMLTFEVDYDIESGSPVAFRATAFERLPDETVLDFTNPPRDSSSDEPR